jgi:hypothetical protein
MPLHDWTRVEASVVHAFHMSWLAQLMQSLNNGLLPEDFYALAEQVSSRFIPDLLTLQETSSHDAPDLSSGGLALLAPAARATSTLDPSRVALPRLQLTIRHISGDRVVAVIEIVSPSNKGSELEYAAFNGEGVDTARLRDSCGDSRCFSTDSTRSAKFAQSLRASLRSAGGTAPLAGASAHGVVSGGAAGVGGFISRRPRGDVARGAPGPV